MKPPASRFLREFLQQEETGNLSAVQLIRHDGNRLTVEGVYALVSTVPDAERGQSGESVPPPAVIFFSVQRLHGFRQVVTHVQPQQKDEL